MTESKTPRMKDITAYVCPWCGAGIEIEVYPGYEYNEWRIRCSVDRKHDIRPNGMEPKPVPARLATGQGGLRPDPSPPYEATDASGHPDGMIEGEEQTITFDPPLRFDPYKDDESKGK